MCRVRGRFWVSPFAVTATLTTIRYAAVRGASLGNAIAPVLTIVTVVAGVVASFLKYSARQRASAGFTVRAQAVVALD